MNSVDLSILIGLGMTGLALGFCYWLWHGIGRLTWFVPTFLFTIAWVGVGGLALSLSRWVVIIAAPIATIPLLFRLLKLFPHGKDRPRRSRRGASRNAETGTPASMMLVAATVLMWVIPMIDPISWCLITITAVLGAFGVWLQEVYARMLHEFPDGTFNDKVERDKALGGFYALAAWQLLTLVALAVGKLTGPATIGWPGGERGAILLGVLLVLLAGTLATSFTARLLRTNARIEATRIRHVRATGLLLVAVGACQLVLPTMLMVGVFPQAPHLVAVVATNSLVVGLVLVESAKATLDYLHQPEETPPLGDFIHPLIHGRVALEVRLSPTQTAGIFLTSASVAATSTAFVVLARLGDLPLLWSYIAVVVSAGLGLIQHVALGRLIENRRLRRQVEPKTENSTPYGLAHDYLLTLAGWLCAAAVVVIDTERYVETVVITAFLLIGFAAANMKQNVGAAAKEERPEDLAMRDTKQRHAWRQVLGIILVFVAPTLVYLVPW